MNKIVREHYPVSKLPEDLQAAMGGAPFARLTLEAASPNRLSLRDWVQRAETLRQEGKIKPITSEEAVERIRAQRDGAEE